jgi:hypothetical protein
MLENINKINWQSLGNANVPWILESLTSVDRETRMPAIYSLATGVIDEDAIDEGRIPYAMQSDVAAHVVPFLIELLGEELIHTSVKDSIIDFFQSLTHYYPFFKDAKIPELTPTHVQRAKELYELVRGGADTYRKLLQNPDLDLKRSTTYLLDYLGLSHE